MTKKFVFQGQTTFIDKPRDTVIQNFQNTYISSDGSTKDTINTEIAKLLELVLKSKNLSDSEKDEISQALHSVAEQFKENKANRLTVKGTLQAIKEIISSASDIATPALGIVATVFKLLGLS